MPSENIVIKVNADDLDAKLSKSMRELGAHHDQYGRLLNAEGKYIGTLSQANVRMGHYIDSQGKMRDAAGRLVEGLTAAEKALRMYIDAHGDVRTAEGEFVRASDAKVEALKREEDQLMKMREFQTLNTAAAMQGLAATAQFASILGQTGGTVGIVSDEVAKLAVTVGSTATAWQVAKGAMKKFFGSAVNGAKQSVSWLGKLGSVLGPVAAVVATYLAGQKIGEKAGEWIFSPGYGDPAEPIKKRVDAINELTLATKRFGASVESLPLDMLFGVSSSMAGTTQADLMSARIAQLDKLAADVDKSSLALAKANERLNSANVRFQQSGALGGMMPGNRLTAAAKEYRDAETELNKSQALYNADRDALGQAKAEYVAAMREMIAQDTKSDPLRELARRAEIYADAIQRSKDGSDSYRSAQEALMNVSRSYAEALNPATPKALDAALAQAAKEMGETSDAFKTASSSIRQVYNKNRLAQSESYIESLREQMKTPTDRLREEQEKLKEAYKAGAVSFHELAEMNSFLRDKYEEKAAAEDSPQPVWKEPDYHAPKSAAYGSQQLYEMLTRRDQDAWRDKLQSTVSDVKSHTEEANEYLRDMRDGILAFRDVGVTV